MTDNGIVVCFIFLKKILSARECDLVDVLIHLFGGHAQSRISNGEGLFLFIDTDPDGQIAHLTFEVTHRSEGL